LSAIGQQHVVVIGAGITGLAAAHRVRELAPDVRVTVLEAGPRAGGVLETVRTGDYLIEHSADNFITNVPWAIDLCRRIGLGDELLATSTEQRGALVVHRGKIERVPAGYMLMAPAKLWPMLTTPLLSPLGKLRLLAEPLVPRRKTPGDESLASFVRRRLGREAFENIVQPLVGGIYTADPEKLSLAATLPRFLDMERKHGGLIRAARAAENPAPQGAESGVRYGLFYTLRNGLSSLVERLVEKLPPGSVRLNAPVRSIRRDAGGVWQFALASGEALSADALVVAVGAPQAARLLEEVDETATKLLRQIEYAGTSIVSLVYRRSEIARPLDAFGFVVPAVEKRRILAGSFSSLKFAGRAPSDQVLVRVFIGGALQRELADLPDAELTRIATEELRDLIGARGEPLLVDIARWPASMPQYHVGHTALVAAIEAAAARHRGLALAGSAYHGVGIPHCIHNGEQAAEAVLAALRSA
jgi:oxygen-dependent protoporphyrinogen oxidase